MNSTAFVMFRRTSSHSRGTWACRLKSLLGHIGMLTNCLSNSKWSSRPGSWLFQTYGCVVRRGLANITLLGLVQVVTLFTTNCGPVVRRTIKLRGQAQPSLEFHLMISQPVGSMRRTTYQEPVVTRVSITCQRMG